MRYKSPDSHKPIYMYIQMPQIQINIPFFGVKNCWRRNEMYVYGVFHTCVDKIWLKWLQPSLWWMGLVCWFAGFSFLLIFGSEFAIQRDKHLDYCVYFFCVRHRTDNRFYGESVRTAAAVSFTHVQACTACTACTEIETQRERQRERQSDCWCVLRKIIYGLRVVYCDPLKTANSIFNDLCSIQRIDPAD